MKKFMMVLLVISTGCINISLHANKFTMKGLQQEKNQRTLYQKTVTADLIAAEKKEAQTQYNNLLPSLIRSYAADRAKYTSQVNLMGKDLSNDDLAKYDLQGAGLLGVIIGDSTANTQGANLSYADLRYSCLVGANLSKGLFKEADLSSAYLSWGVFINADFTKANLTEAHLEGADLTGAIFTDAIVKDATYDKYTKLPKSLNTNQLATMVKVTT